MSRMAGRFTRVEARHRARQLVLGLLADLPRKNCVLRTAPAPVIGTFDHSLCRTTHHRRLSSTTVGLQEPEPDFADRREGGDCVPQLLHRRFRGHRDGRRVQQFLNSWTDESDTENRAAVGVDQHACLSAVALGVLRRSRQVGNVVIHHLDVASGRLSLGSRQAHARYVRVGEDHLGNGLVVCRRGMCAPHCGVQGLALSARR